MNNPLKGHRRSNAGVLCYGRLIIEHLPDCSGEWGEISYYFKADTAEIYLLAEWDTIINHSFAMQAIEYLRAHRNNKLSDKIMLTFIGSEQRNCIEMMPKKEKPIISEKDSKKGNAIESVNF